MFGAPRWVVARRFPVLADHPGETDAYRRRFRNAAGLLFAYRAAGTAAALIAFAGDPISDGARARAIEAAATLYILWAIVICFQTATVKVPFPWSRHRRLGMGRHAALDSPIALGIDLVLAMGVNLVLAFLLPDGTAFTQYTDVFAVASITTAALWTGRRGGVVGAFVTVGLALVELLKAPINGIPWDEIDQAVLVTRWFWFGCGWLVALGTVRILLDYADWAQTVRVEEERLDAVGHVHDDYRSALVKIAATSDAMGDPRDLLAGAVERAKLALDTLEEPTAPEATMAGIVARTVARGQWAEPDGPEFNVVDGVKRTVWLRDPVNVERALLNLCVNAARYSMGSMVTIRWRIDDLDLKITVLDDGIGMPDTPNTGNGLKLVRSSIDHAGGTAELEPDRPSGTKWKIRMPHWTFAVDGEAG